MPTSSSCCYRTLTRCDARNYGWWPEHQRSGDSYQFTTSIANFHLKFGHHCWHFTQFLGVTRRRTFVVTLSDQRGILLLKAQIYYEIWEEVHLLRKLSVMQKGSSAMTTKLMLILLTMLEYCCWVNFIGLSKKARESPKYNNICLSYRLFPLISTFWPWIDLGTC